MIVFTPAIATHKIIRIFHAKLGMKVVMRGVRGVSKEVSEIYFMSGMYNEPPMTIDLHPAFCITFIEVCSI